MDEISPDLDRVFFALADSTRREILRKLSKGEASVNELVAPFDLTQPAISRHLKVLEKAGLVERGIDKQRRPARLRSEKLGEAMVWLRNFEGFWHQNLDQLDIALNKIIEEEEKG